VTAGLSINRPLVGDGSLPALAIGVMPTMGGYWFPSDGISEPEFDETTTYAETSPNLAGGLATQSVTGIGTLALTVLTEASSEANLKTQKQALEAAVRQFSYTVALTTVGAADTYTCIRGRISWGTLNAAMSRAFIARCVITIPVQPLGV